MGSGTQRPAAYNSKHPGKKTKPTTTRPNNIWRNVTNRNNRNVRGAWLTNNNVARKKLAEHRQKLIENKNKNERLNRAMTNAIRTLNAHAVRRNLSATLPGLFKKKGNNNNARARAAAANVW